MTILLSSIVAKAKILAQDSTGIRWTDPEWIGWATDIEGEIVSMRPSAYSKVTSVTLVAGTKQTIPTDGSQFLEYVRYMGAGGAQPGSAARKVSKRLMDSQTPNWHAAAAVAVPKHYVFEPVAPKTFYVYPPSTGGVQAEIIYAAIPPAFATLSDSIHVDDSFQASLLYGMLFRAYAKDNEDVANAERSVFYRKSFENSMGLKSQADAAVLAAPNPKG